MSTPVVRAVLWDADGVLQHTPADAWDLAVGVVQRFPGALTGTPVDEHRIRTAATDLGLDDRIDEVLAVWSTFDVLEPTLAVVAAVGAAGTPCHLATNQDTHRARVMRERTPYAAVFDRLYFSCDIGVAKPSAGYFTHVVDDLGLPPAEVLFLDDQPANVAGARAVGLRAEVWSHDDGVDRLRAILRAHGVPLGDGSERDVQRP